MLSRSVNPFVTIKCPLSLLFVLTSIVSVIWMVIQFGSSCLWCIFLLPFNPTPCIWVFPLLSICCSGGDSILCVYVFPVITGFRAGRASSALSGKLPPSSGPTLKSLCAPSLTDHLAPSAKLPGFFLRKSLPTAKQQLIWTTRSLMVRTEARNILVPWSGNYSTSWFDGHRVTVLDPSGEMCA